MINRIKNAINNIYGALKPIISINMPKDSPNSIINKKVKLSKQELKDLRKKTRKTKILESKIKEPLELNKNNSSDYYIENGLRKVLPYEYTFRSTCKGRWIGRTIVDVFRNEFKLSQDRIKTRILNEDILVCDKPVNDEYQLKQSDVITHNVHRHELPVTAEDPVLIGRSNGLMAVYKPAGVPVHVTGKYYKNTLMNLLGNLSEIEHKPKILHRLDRMTSGILLLAENYERSRQVSREIEKRNVDKFYLAQVCGRFPETSRAGLGSDSNSQFVHDPITVDVMLNLSSPAAKISIVFVEVNSDKSSESSSTKPSTTHFIRLDYDDESDSSLVLCQPVTGRTHQIRVHLQYLGHPIINDPLYNNSAWGSLIGKGGDYGNKSQVQIQDDLACSKPIKKLRRIEVGDLNNSDSENEDAEVSSGTAVVTTKRLWQPFPGCESCETFHDHESFSPNDLILNLHAYRYRLWADPVNWDFICPLPSWVTNWKRGKNSTDLISQIKTITDFDESKHDSRDLSTQDTIVNCQ